MPPLSHLTSCTPTKSNLYLANSLAAAVSEPALYSLLKFQVPNLMSLFRWLDLTKVSVQVRGKGSWFTTKSLFTVMSFQHTAQNPSWRTTPCRLSATAYSIYSLLPSILEAVPLSATRGRAKPRWQGLCVLHVMLYNNYYLAGCPMFPHLPAPISQSCDFSPLIVSISPIFFL